MKKCKKIIIFMLIAIMLIPLNIFAAVTPSANNTLQEIATYYIEKNKDLSGVNDAILQSWNIIICTSESGILVTPGSIEYFNLLEKEIEVPIGIRTEKIKRREIMDAITKVMEERHPKIKPSAYNTLNEIAEYYKQNGGNLSGVTDNILISWYKNMHNNISTMSINSQDDKQKAYTAIQKELDKRNIDKESIDTNDVYDFNDIEDENDLKYWTPTTGNNTKLADMAGKILGLIQAFGSVASVGALVVIGIKYMLGSIEEKAKYKETMIPYIVGCIMLFAISNIASAIYKFATNL